MVSLTDNPLVSIIMSAYNAEKTIEKSVLSLLNQSYQNLEVIVINDGSSDKTLEVLNRLCQSDSRVRVFDQDNTGLTKALNKAIVLSKGKYIARQDADDISTPDRILKKVELLEKRSDLDFLTSQACLNDIKVVPVNLVVKFCTHQFLNTGNAFIHGTFFGRRYLFDEIGYDESYKVAQDFKFITELIDKEIRIGIIPKSFYKLIQTGNNISTLRFEEQQRNVLRALDESKTLNSFYKRSPLFLRVGLLGKVIKLFLLFYYRFRTTKNQVSVIYL